MSNLGLKRRRDILRQKWQFLAVVVTVVLGVMMFAGSYNAYLNLGSSLDGSYERLAMADMTVTGADDGWLEAARAIDGVRDAVERQQADVPFAVGDASFVGRIIGMPVGSQPDVNRIDIDEGRYLQPDDPTGVVVETHLATEYTIGDEKLYVMKEDDIIAIV